MKLHLWLLVVLFVFFDCCNSFGIPESSLLYSHPFIYGSEDFQNGSVIGLACNLTRENPEKEIPKYTFVMMKNENCRKFSDLDLSKYVTYSKDGLFLRYPLDASFQGKKTFACVLKSNKREPPPGCHTVYVGPKPGRPTVSCVSHGFRRLRCTITPSGEKLKNSTGLILPRHKFSESYQLILHDKRKVNCVLDSKKECRFWKKGILTYVLPDYFVTYFEVRILLKNLFGESKVTQFFNMCKIEQPVTGKIQAYNIKPTSVYINWTVVDSFFPTDKKYFQNRINCTSPNSQFNYSSFKLNHFFNNLQPFTMYDCVIRTRSNLKTKDQRDKNARCIGQWSEPKSISFRTRPSAPNVGPLVPQGTVLKNGNSCQLYFFEIPKDERNGIVNRYRISLLPVSSRQQPVYTEFLNPSFDCSKRIDVISISGKTKDCQNCWSPDREVDFSSVSAEEHVDIELWKNGSNRYETVAKFSKELDVRDAFLVICNCSNTCRESNFDCVGMRYIKYPNPTAIDLKSERRASLIFEEESFSLGEEKISVHLSFWNVRRNQVAYAMSEWTSCAYDKNSNFTVERSQFPAIKRPVVVKNDRVSFTFNREELACSATIVKPVYKVYTRVTCGEIVEKFTTLKGSQKVINVSVPLQPHKSCEVDMSLDNKAFVHRYQHAGSSQYIFVITVVIGIVLVLGISLCCVYYKEKLKSQWKTLFETKTTKVINVNEPMDHTMDTTYRTDYNHGYDSIELANTTAETGRGSNEESFPEQGVTHDNTASTHLLGEYSCDIGGYVEHESNVIS